MSTQIFENIKGSELIESLKENIHIHPDQTYRVIIEAEQDEEAMPAEERITDEAMQAVHASELEHQKGDYVECANAREIGRFFEGITR